MATLTTGGMIGDDPLGNRSSFVRPMGHRIYVPMETSFVNAMRFQGELDDEEKKGHGPPKYEATHQDPSATALRSS